MIRARAHLCQTLRITVERCTQAELDCRHFPYAVAVHRHDGGAGRRHDRHALCLDFGQHLGTDRLDLRHDIVRLVLLDRRAQQAFVQHGKDFERVGNLHGGRTGVAVACDHLATQPLGRDNEFTTKLT